jgi:hypothetical protein
MSRYMLNAHHLIKDNDSVLKEEQRQMRIHGMSELDATRLHHTATKMRVASTVPRPDVLMERWDKLMEVFRDMPGWTNPKQGDQSKVTVNWTDNPEKLAKEYAKYERDVKNDRYSDPAGEKMYAVRRDGTIISRRGTNKQESKHKYMRQASDQQPATFIPTLGNNRVTDLI